MNNRKPCPVVQYSDMTQCEECLLCWDTNDPDEPPCPKQSETPEAKRLKDRAVQCLYWALMWLVLIGFVYITTAPLARWVAEWLVAHS